ncbi:sensor histidine kinase [Clostridium sp. 'White wine YQ']|uniref:sensor histidine kinase n=1 Tax=Clostridium sp. 'White wine YQ' TaxID=3027474 RepID=UPI0023667863|nr:HAMP domain-containing sensor histidine kinase [Clostridium sp. 'White wine YQ']MDD7794149.1 HAMP domain-containing sensor histidine kinase [Clostridium sp. 'White wine YQ']
MKNYVISFFLMFFVLILSLFISAIIGMVYFKVDLSDPTSPKNFMQDDYTKIDSSPILEMDGYMVIIDKNGKIVNRHGQVAAPFDKDKISIADISTLINYSEKESNFVLDVRKKNFPYVYRTAYNQKNDFLMVIGIPSKKYTELEIAPKRLTVKQFILISFGIFMLFFLLVFYLYSRITSSYFLTPLKILTHGAKKLATGNYSTRINLTSKNEFKNLGDAFNIMASKIEEETNLREKSEESRKRLILDISHDLKTPLASVLGYSDYLIQNPDLPKEDVIKYLSVIKRNSERSNNLILDLFDYSKLDSWNFTLSKEKEDICEFLREFIASYIPRLEESGFEYDFDIPEKEIPLLFDRKNLDRALGNIVINSTKYNPNGTLLKISCFEKDNYLNIIIEDNGVGIPKNEAQSMFDPFTRGDKSRTSENTGTGLGLAITKTIITKHKGTITLESELNKGCKFIIKLPLNNLKKKYNLKPFNMTII